MITKLVNEASGFQKAIIQGWEGGSAFLMNPQTEWKQIARWREEQRQRRWNCLNQSFILLLPIGCTVIEVKVTGSGGLLFHSTQPPDIPHCCQTSIASCVRVFPGVGLVRVCKHEQRGPWFTDGDAMAAGAVGGYQGDSSTSTLSRWIPRHCHLLAKTWMCHTKLRVLPRD